MFATEEAIFFTPGLNKGQMRTHQASLPVVLWPVIAFGSLLELAHVGPKEYTMIAKMMASQWLI